MGGGLSSGKPCCRYQHYHIYSCSICQFRILSVCVCPTSECKTPTSSRIEPGSSSPTQTKNFIPKEADGALAASNKVVWKNSDSVAHSVTSDTDYKDKVSGPFNSIAKTGLIPPQQSYEFTFTAEGEYHYHCEPHPWMQAVVKISKEKFQIIKNWS